MDFLFVKGLKLLFFSAGLISTLLMAKPFFHEIFLPNLAAFCSSFRFFFSSPLYICIIINSVVFLIAATSTFHRHDPPPPPPRWDDEATAVEAEPPETTALLSTTHIDHDDDEDEKYCSTSTTCYNRQDDHDHDDHLDDCSKVNFVKKIEREEEKEEREGEGDDTSMESTWKAIIGSKTKKLTKSESVPPRSARIEDDLTAQKELRKLETFNEGGSPPIRRIGGLIRRDPSVGLDELNQQVEAFIKKFNRDMRLQRQESDQRFLDMIKREL